MNGQYWGTADPGLDSATGAIYGHEARHRTITMYRPPAGHGLEGNQPYHPPAVFLV